MIPSFKNFVQLCSKDLPTPEPIYEFGALQPPGQIGFADLRPFFQHKSYVGTDYRPGPGVDRVLDLHHLELPDASVGTALVIAVLEHVERPWVAISELHRVVRPGGWVAIASHMNFPIHSHPHDYWRFTPEAFRSLLKPFDSCLVASAGDPLNPQSVVAVGFKGPLPETARLEMSLRAWSERFTARRRELVKQFLPPIALRLYHALLRR